MKIAIIGAGLTGSTILESILRHKNFNKDIHISIFDKRLYYGAGFPHEKDTLARVLNVQSHLMSVNDEDPNEFINWLKENKKEESFEKVAPRTYYGEYLHHHFKEYFEHENVQFINGEVIDVSPHILNSKINSYDIKTTQNIYKNFDYLFLAIGHPIYKDMYDFKDIDKFIWNTYPLNESLYNLKNTDKIGVIGTGASALDVFRHIMTNCEYDPPLYFLARSTLFDTPDFTYGMEKPKYKFSMNHKWISDRLKSNTFIKLDDIVNLIKNDFKYNDTDFYKLLEKVKFNDIEDYRKFIDEKDSKIAILIDYFKKLFPYLTTLYGNLSNLDKLRLIKEYDEDIEKFITLIPSKTFDWIYDEIKKENVKIIKQLEDIEYSNKKFIVSANKDIKLDVLINTTGFTFDVLENIQHNELLKNLYDKCLIKPDSNGEFISVKWPNCNALSTNYGLIDNLFVQGMWIGRTHYRNNDALSVNRLAKATAKKFMEKI